MSYELQDWVNLFAAALAPITAIVAIYIGYQQYRAQREANRLGLYDRRRVLYRAYRRLLSALVFDTTLVPEKIEELLPELTEAKFLFQPDEVEAIDNAVAKAKELVTVSQTMKGDPPQYAKIKEYSQQKLIEIDGAGRNWAWNELQRAEERFGRYLRAE